MTPRSPTLTEAIPVATEQDVLPVAAERPLEPVVVDALQTIAAHDTMDVYGRRLRGTSMLATRGITMAGLPAVGIGLISESITFGPQTFLIGGTTATIAGTTIAGLMYTGQRLTEKSRALGAEQAEAVIRNHLAEPVDVIRDKHRGHALSVRWYGADERYGNSEDAGLVDRFAKIVDFAEAYEVAEVVVPASLFARGDEASLQDRYKDKLTTTRDFFVQKKGIPIEDRSADETLAQLTPGEARELATELQAVAQVSKTDVIATWLMNIRPEHPLAAAYTEWQRLGQPAELRPRLARIMQSSLDRHFSSIDLTPGLKLAVTDEQGHTIGHTRLRVGTSVTVSPQGITRLSTAQTQAHGEQPTHISRDDFSAILGCSVDEFIDQLLERKGGQLLPHEQWKLELALYHLLQKPDNHPATAGRVRTRTVQAEVETDTLYERMLQEKPRTSAVWPSVRRRGDVPKDEQTIKYNRLFWRNAGKKVGAFVLATAIGGAAGVGWGMAWGQDEMRDITCQPPAPKEASQLVTPDTSTPEEIAEYCDSNLATFYDILGTAAQHVYDGNATYEDLLLIKAYELGILTPDSLDFFKSSVNKAWVNERARDISERHNLYGGGETQVGDVQLGSNPALWSLKPMNGAQTTGYWPMNVQSHITVESTEQLADDSLPPLADASVAFDNPSLRKKLVPLGTPITTEQQEEVEFIRVLSVPRSPSDLNKPLISVSGRQIPQGSELALFDLSTDYNWQRTFALPVIQGGDIVAAKVVIRSLSDDKVMETPPVTFYQRADGTFAFRIPQSNDDYAAKGYLDIQYWVEPGANTDLPVRAEHPMTAQTVGETSQPLTALLTPQDVAAMRQTLGLSDGQNAEAVGGAIASTRAYSFTPYGDSRGAGDVSVFKNPTAPLPTREILRLVGEYAAHMDKANCNVAELIEILSTRGVDGERFLNAINGFHEDGDGVLSQAESHAWVVASDGKFIDATPGGGVIPPAEPYKESPKHGSDDSLGEIVRTTVALAALGMGTYTGYRFGPGTLAGIRRRRRESAAEWFNDDTVDGDVRLLGHLLYSRPGTHIDDSDLPASVTQGPARDGAARLRAVPGIGSRAIGELVAERRADGVLKLSAESERRLRTVVAKAQRARGYRPPRLRST